ncbi:MAG: molybdate ABC transporter substrate-binding protein [Spirochaetota bacterium]
MRSRAAGFVTVALLRVALATHQLSATGATESGSESAASEVRVFAAASTTDLMAEIAERYEAATGVSIVLNPASSGTLARQIEEGAPADVFVSASRRWMDHAEERGLVSEHDAFAGNRLVLIVPSDSPIEPFEASAASDVQALVPGPFAIGDPSHVPAGAYARDALMFLGWYGRLESRLVFMTNVRAVLSLVAMGEADAGIVYETEARRSTGVRVVARFPERSHAPISYECGLVVGATAAGAAFYDFLAAGGDAVAGAIAAHAFSPPPTEMSGSMQVDRSELAVRTQFVALHGGRTAVLCHLPLRSWVTEVRHASFLTFSEQSR